METTRDIPFSVFAGTVKFIRSGDLPLAARSALDFACPAFDESLWHGQENAENKATREKVTALAHLMGLETSDTNLELKRRRFAGDTTLPRSCYFGVCRGPDGDD